MSNESSEEEFLEIIEDAYEDEAEEEQLTPWKILITDDEQAVHDATLFSLASKKFLGHPLEFIHAYSAEEAYQILKDTPDIAVIFLDVVMETVDAGLKLVPQIRHKLKRHALRIILRTGQPGYAPEEVVVTEYDINDYHTKSELTHQKMVTALNTALRAYQEIERLSNVSRVLKKIINATEDLLKEESVERFSSTLLTHLSEFFFQSLDGYVAIKPAGKDHVVVSGTCGKFKKMQYRDLYEIVHDQLTGLAKNTLIAKQSTIHEIEAALFFHADNHSAVAYLNPTNKEDRLLYKQYHLDMLTRNVSMCLSKLPASEFSGLIDKIVE